MGFCKPIWTTACCCAISYNEHLLKYFCIILWITASTYNTSAVFYCWVILCPACSPRIWDFCCVSFKTLAFLGQLVAGLVRQCASIVAIILRCESQLWWLCLNFLKIFLKKSIFLWIYMFNTSFFSEEKNLMCHRTKLHLLLTHPL